MPVVHSALFCVLLCPHINISSPPTPSTAIGPVLEMGKLKQRRLGVLAVAESLAEPVFKMRKCGSSALGPHLPQVHSISPFPHPGHWAGKARVGWSLRAPVGRMHEYIGLTGFCFKLISIFFNPTSQSIIRSPYLALHEVT